MNRPGLRTLLLGSRLTAPLIMLGSAYVTYRWWEAGGQGLLGFATIALFLASGKAMGEVAAYRRWRADWRAMSPQEGARSAGAHPTVKRYLRLVGVVAVFAALCAVASHGGEAGTMAEIGLGLAGIVATLALVAKLVAVVWRAPRRDRPEPTRLVTVAISRPLLPVPSLRRAYRSLPRYCAPVLKARS